MLSEEQQNVPLTNQMIETAKNDLPFKIHVGVGFILCSLAVGLWTIFAFIFSNPPWWIIVISFFGITISIHYFVFLKQPRDLFKAHCCVYVFTNLTLFLFWAYYSQQSRAAWFVYPLIMLAIPLAWHFLYERFPPPLSFLYMHLALFALINLFFFVICIDLDQSAWFIITLTVFGLPVLAHLWYVYYRPRYFVLHAWLFADLNLMFFWIWVISTPQSIPWYIFILAPWALLLAAHYKFKPDPDSDYGPDANYNPNDLPYNPNAAPQEPPYNPNAEPEVYNPNAVPSHNPNAEMQVYNPNAAPDQEVAQPRQ